MELGNDLAKEGKVAVGDESVENRVAGAILGSDQGPVIAEEGEERGGRVGGEEKWVGLL
jgi:hypothetical protein